jgi:hypothetical protein
MRGAPLDGGVTLPVDVIFAVDVTLTVDVILVVGVPDLAVIAAAIAQTFSIAFNSLSVVTIE